MSQPGATTLSVQRYLDALAGDSPADPVVRALLERAVLRLQTLCANLLRRSYPRLAEPPLNLEADELLSAVVERLLRALQAVKPGNVRQFFALANQHMRWELNEFARRLDQQPAAMQLHSDAVVLVPESRDDGVTARYRAILGAIDALPEEEREVFHLVRVQGLTHGEAAEVIGASTKTVQRRLNRGLLRLASSIGGPFAGPGTDGAGAP